MSRLRGFEVVSEGARRVFEEAKVFGEVKRFYPEITLPKRSDAGSAGYDLFAPYDIMLLPGQKYTMYLDIKAYMQPDEVLELYPRSSMGIKRGLMLSNTVGIVDSSYYNNEGNEGNIGLALLNTSGVGHQIKRGDRLAQGIFKKFLTVDEEDHIDSERIGGFGSSGE